MKRLRWLTFHALTALCLLLFFATALLWLRGYHTRDTVGRALSWGAPRMRGYTIELSSWKGHLDVTLCYTRVTAPPPIVGYSSHFTWSRYPVGRYLIVEDFPVWSKMGFYYCESDSDAGSGFITAATADYPSYTYGAPDWALMLLIGFPPLTLLVLRNRRRRKSPGLCTVCGYDLRATPARCPECGTTPDKSP